MRKLCFGGTFNPIHHGHLICSRVVADAAGFERIVLIPSGQPPFKQQHADLASPQDRAVMCDLAVRIDPERFEVDRVEIDRCGQSYTYDTVSQLSARDGQRVTWLIGADTLGDLHHWHRAEALLADIDFLVMARPGYSIDWSTLSPMVQKLRDRVVVAPLIEISATEIRRRVSLGKSLAFLTPAPVCEFIERNHLYRTGPQ